MNWDAITGIGTIGATCVGIIGIWLNLYEKTKKLLIKAEYAPRFVIYATNDSMRTVIITKIVFSIDTHVFYVDIRDGLQELRIQPSGVDRITFNGSSVVQSYHKAGMEKLCNPTDKIGITIHDNYKRKYKIRTDLTIGMFESYL